MRKLRILLQDYMNSFRTILLGFFALILCGACLLCLPAASADGQGVPFLNALFTSTSAACVTGLVVYDTATQWSMFGRIVILVLIQIGGLGVVTAFIATMLLTGKRIGLMQRIAMQDAVSAPQLGGIVRFTSFFLKATVVIEAAGTVLLAPVFIRDFGFVKGMGHALFHSVSAFCNAGFDLMGVRAPFSSLTGYASDIWITSVISLLIIIGGAGFFTWGDLLENRFRFKGLRLQTKLILTTTAVLLTVPFIYFFVLEFAGMPLKERFLLSAFQTVTPRTAGFNTADYGAMTEGSLLVTVILMMIGGAPGSTAGGIKITTIAVIFLSARTYMKGREHTNAFRRRIETDAIHNAYTLFVLYLMLLVVGTIALSEAEDVPIMPAMFECASALGTVGLTTGITPGLSVFSRIILIFFMYFGRVGGLTLTYSIVSLTKKENSRLPAEKLTVG